MHLSLARLELRLYRSCVQDVPPNLVAIIFYLRDAMTIQGWIGALALLLLAFVLLTVAIWLKVQVGLLRLRRALLQAPRLIRMQKSGHPESNQGPSDFCNNLQSDALPTEL